MAIVEFGRLPDSTGIGLLSLWIENSLTPHCIECIIVFTFCWDHPIFGPGRRTMHVVFLWSDMEQPHLTVYEAEHSVERPSPVYEKMYESIYPVKLPSG